MRTEYGNHKIRVKGLIVEGTIAYNIGAARLMNPLNYAYLNPGCGIGSGSKLSFNFPGTGSAVRIEQSIVFFINQDVLKRRLDREFRESSKVFRII